MNAFRWLLAVLLLPFLPACFVLQSSTESIDPRQEYCETVIDYCLLYPDTLQQVALLEEEHGLRLALPALDSEVAVRGYRNYVYHDMQGWYETEIRSKEAAYSQVEVIESGYTDNFLRLHMELDGRLHLVQVHRLGQERWVVVRWEAAANNRRSDIFALFDRIDVIPGSIEQ